MAGDPGALGRLTGERLLVTGASGFLGRHVCARLVAVHADVHAVSRTARVSTEASLRWWQVDVESPDETRRLVSEVTPDVIFHLGGLVNGAPDITLVVPTFQSLVTSTVNLLQAATETGCRRVVLVGSLEEPDRFSGEVWPTSPYGAAKAAASVYGQMFQELFGVPIVVTRPHMTYGPGQPAWKLIPSTIRSLLRGESPLLSSGQRALDWIYVDDVVEGLLLAAATPNIEGVAFDLGTGRLTPIREVVRMLVELLAPDVRPIFGALPDRRRGPERPANVAQTRAVTGWRPRTSLGDGLMRTVEWYRQQDTGRERRQP